MKIKNIINISLSMACITVANSAIAAEVAVDSQLPDGQSLLIEQINANFQELFGRLSDTSGSTAVDVYDYRDYVPATSITSKVFSVSGGNMCENTETKTYQRTLDGSNTNTDVTIIRTNSNTAAFCRRFTHHFVETPTAYEHTGLESQSEDGTVESVVTHEPALTRLTSSMSQNQLFSFHAEYTDTYIPYNDITTGLKIESFQIVGVEDVTVPAGTFNNCIKLNIVLNGTVPRQRITWRCPGIGMVKRVQTNNNSGYKIWQLQSIAP